ncbi:unnamed protein product [Boreogadus saida]
MNCVNKEGSSFSDEAASTVGGVRSYRWDLITSNLAGAVDRRDKVHRKPPPLLSAHASHHTTRCNTVARSPSRDWCHRWEESSSMGESMLHQ